MLVLVCVVLVLVLVLGGESRGGPAHEPHLLPYEHCSRPPMPKQSHPCAGRVVGGQACRPNTAGACATATRRRLGSCARPRCPCFLSESCGGDEPEGAAHCQVLS